MRPLAVCTIFWISLISGPTLAVERAGITIRVLYDNYAHDNALQTDWGFACLITGTESTILFDTGGKGELLLSNFEKMQVKPSQVDFVVISHTHQDHIGGLLPFLGRNGRVGVYLPIDTPQQFVEQAKQKAASVTVVTEPREICRGVTVLGPLGDKIKERLIRVSCG